MQKGEGRSVYSFSCVWRWLKSPVFSTLFRLKKDVNYSNSMFFEQEREQFFRPLTGKYRAQIAECLRELYKRLYSSSSADYGQALQRDLLLEIFQEALVRAPLLASDDEDGESRFKNSREQAGWVLNQLLEHGWLEKQLDTVSMHSTFSFSRYGRLFTEPFAAQSKSLAHTRHRNTRNTRNALEAFLERGDLYDLLDAYDYSERIISDFTDIIAELEERKRDLVREMEDQLLVQHASEAFFDFMENRFQPDLSVRLSADNVEKHRDYIGDLIQKIRKRDKAFKAQAERRLRELLPDLARPDESLLWFILAGIEQRLRNASEIMLPALRKALQSFTKRADIIMRQMSYLASAQHNDVLSVCKHLVAQSSMQQEVLLSRAAQHMAGVKLELIDPAQVRLAPPKQKSFAASALDEGKEEVDIDARREIYVQQILDQAFLINQQALRQYLKRHLVIGKKLSSQDLPIENAQDFLAVANAIGLGSSDSLSSEFFVKVSYDESATHASSAYFTKKDHFIFELVEKES